MLSARPSEPAGATRTRRYRARQRNGERVLKIVVCENELAEALLASGRLGEREALDRAQLEREIGALVKEWVSRWRR
jgi:hypothetical protein